MFSSSIFILLLYFFFFFFNDPAPTEIYTLSLHDALPIFWPVALDDALWVTTTANNQRDHADHLANLMHHEALQDRSEEHTSELQSPDHLVCRLLLEKKKKKTKKQHNTKNKKTKRMKTKTR